MAKKQEGKAHHMTREERYKLEAYLKAGKSKSWIAKEMGFCRQTIYNEIERGAYWHTTEYGEERRYSADKAQQIHDQNQTAKGPELKIGNDHNYANFLEKKMLGGQEDGTVDKRKRCSPAAALELARREGFKTSVSVSTLYRYIDKGVFLNVSNKDLWEKEQRKKKKNPVRRSPHPQLPSITERPEVINQRGEAGHKEIDLVVGKKGTSAALLTITDRMTRQEMAIKIPNKKAESVRAVFDRLERRLGKKKFREMFRSITTDNGSEFLENEKLTKSVFSGSRFVVYYCHSYCAWEKGTNENHNRLLRRFFPKGTDFTKISQKKIQEAVDFLNNYPRKILEWKTPNEVM